MTGGENFMFKYPLILSAALRSGSVDELGVLRLPYQCNGSDGAVTLFGYDYFRLVGLLRILIIIIEMCIRDRYSPRTGTCR